MPLSLGPSYLPYLQRFTQSGRRDSLSSRRRDLEHASACEQLATSCCRGEAETFEQAALARLPHAGLIR
jgi:hypothetical protein